MSEITFESLLVKVTTLKTWYEKNSTMRSDEKKKARLPTHPLTRKVMCMDLEVVERLPSVLLQAIGCQTVEEEETLTMFINFRKQKENLMYSNIPGTWKPIWMGPKNDDLMSVKEFIFILIVCPGFYEKYTQALSIQKWRADERILRLRWGPPGNRNPYVAPEIVRADKAEEEEEDETNTKANVKAEEDEENVLVERLCALALVRNGKPEQATASLMGGQ